MKETDVKNESMAAAQTNSVSQTYINPTPGEITIVGLGRLQTTRLGFNRKTEEYLSDKSAQLLVEIGCNASQSQLAVTSSRPDYVNIQKSLDACQAAGIKLIPKFGMPKSGSGAVYFTDIQTWYDKWVTCWGEVAAKYRNHPALGAWFMCDEPTTIAMEKALARAKPEVLKNDSTHNVLVNLFGELANKEDLNKQLLQLNGESRPTNSKEGDGTMVVKAHNLDEYYDYFQQTFAPAIWSSDFYPFGFAYGYANCGLREEFYEYLLRMKNLSAKTGRPFWTYVACNLKFIPSPKDKDGNDIYDNDVLASHIDALTIGRLRFQTFMALAYGAQGICYWNIFGDGETYRAMPVGVNGHPTSLFDIVKTVNEEIKSYNSVFCGGFPTYLAVIKDPAVDKTDEKLPVITGSYEYLKSISRAPSDKWLYAKYSNGTNTYLILQNMDYLESKVVTVKFKDFPNTYRQVLPGGQLSDYITGYDGEVQPGGVLIFKIGYK